MAERDTATLLQFKSMWTDVGSKMGVISVKIESGSYDMPFSNDYETTVTFEAYESLPNDLIWELIYVGSTTNSSFDQILMSVNYGAAEKGEHKFLMEAPYPDVKKIPVAELIGATKIILKAKYNGQECLTIEWPVIMKSPAANIDELLELPLSNPVMRKLNLKRRINMHQYTVTAHEIDWEGGNDFDMENAQ